MTGSPIGGEPLPGLGINLGQLACFLGFWAIQMYFIVHGMESIRKLETYTAPLKIAICFLLLWWVYGKVGGFAHLATLVKKMKAERPGALLLDGGDTWQGSGTALWTKGQDMVDAGLLLGVDVMTAHWEMTLGDKRVQEIVGKDFKGKVDFVAQN
ncbi:hypothetical protein DVK02_18175, partial [Halobellus sp. Atlit-31R]